MPCANVVCVMKMPRKIGFSLRKRERRAIGLLMLSCFLMPGWVSATSRRLAPAADYHSYIDPLLGVEDFRTRYYEDGAADATVLFPQNDQPPPNLLKPQKPVIALVRLGKRSLPLLIDCLGDGRITTMRFEGNKITQPMNVPVGYVCMDILMNVVRGGPVSDPECGDD